MNNGADVVFVQEAVRRAIILNYLSYAALAVLVYDFS